MRSVRLLLLTAALGLAAGCSWLKDTVGRPGPGMPLDPAEPSRLVALVNDQARQLQSLEYENISVRVSGKDMILPANLRGNLAAAQPRYFRLVAQHPVAAVTVDLGSNPEHCWLYAKVPSNDPAYVTATHADFQSGRAELPGGIKFDPDWVMQALGMTTLPPDGQYTAKAYQRDRVYGERVCVLGWPGTGPGGQPVRREVVFASRDGRFHVQKHLIWDERGQKLIASADIKSTQPTGTGAEYPTRVVLRWEEQKFEMDLDLRGRPAVVNQLTPDNQARRGEFAHLFTRPDALYQKTPIDLAGGVEPAGARRGQSRR
ncbi:MAG: IgGFc-binding protein [Gemmataceae bacterium]|nr:IgGFc-binding protein [Gemmataceae bacterium]